MDRVRILHCLETVGSGGVEQTRLSLVEGLDPDRYQHELVCTQAIDALPDKFRAAGCAIHEVGVFRGILDPAPYKRAVAIARHFNPHIIHGAVYEGVALAAVAGHVGRVPVVIGEETSDPTNRRWKGHVLYRILTSLTDHMVAVSPAVKEYLVRGIRVPAGKVTLINNGVADRPPLADSEVRALMGRYGIGQEDFVVGTVGRLFDDYKRVSDLIRAMPSILKACETVRLLIVGTGPDLDMLKALAAHLEVSERVTFAGYQADPRPFYQMMDVFTLASAREAFGLVLVEAMFACLPVVATRVGGIPSVVDEGVTGLLVTPGDPRALAEAIVALRRKPEVAREMGARGRARAISEFGVDTYVSAVDALYSKMLSLRAATKKAI